MLRGELPDGDEARDETGSRLIPGRHRGLPVAIDRAVLLPKEYSRIDRKSSEGAELNASEKPDIVNEKVS